MPIDPRNLSETIRVHLLNKPMRVLILFVLTALAIFCAGSEWTYRFPDAAAPILRNLDLGPTILTILWHKAFDPRTPALELLAMNTNSFEVHQLQPGLTGRILFAMRAPAWKWDEFESRIVEVDRGGEVTWEYRIDQHEPGYLVASDVHKLPNGNVLFPAVRLYGRKVFYLNGEAFKVPAFLAPFDFSLVLEVNRQGETAKQYTSPATHHAEYLPNGNLLTVSAYQDIVREIDPSGGLVWQWDAAEHIRPYSAQNYRAYLPGYVQNVYTWRLDSADWTHMNSAQRLPNGNTLISLRNQDLVIEVDPQGNTIWSYGSLVLKHQHCSWVLENGRLLVTDNGNARVVEVDRATQQVVWEYSDGLSMLIEGCAYRLPDGNTLITDSGNRRILEVTPQKEIVWELLVNITTALDLEALSCYAVGNPIAAGRGYVNREPGPVD